MCMGIELTKAEISIQYEKKWGSSQQLCQENYRLQLVAPVYSASICHAGGTAEHHDPGPKVLLASKGFS